jgi:hypothetical protein
MSNPVFANSNSNSNEFKTVKFSSESQSLLGLYNSAHASGDPLRNSRNVSRNGSGMVSARAASGAGKSEKDGSNLINKIKSGM